MQLDFIIHHTVKFIRMLSICAMMNAFLLAISCASAYKELQPLATGSNCIEKFKPSFASNLYNASVDVYGNHISGLLLFKAMPDSSLRIVFTNEVGISFFDFEFRQNGKFKVHKIFHLLDKRIVIDLLRKDFETIIMRGVTTRPLNGFVHQNEFFYALPGKKETDYFITDKDCATLLRIEKVSKRKKMLEVRFIGIDRQSPDSIYLKHLTFDMQIGLKKIQR